MRKSIILAVSVSAIVTCFAGGITEYKNIGTISGINVTQPTIVEIKNLNKDGNYIIVNENSSSTQQQFQTVKKVIPPQKVEACTNKCVEAPTLADGNENTTFDFPLISNGLQQGRIRINYNSPVLTDSVVFRTTSDSYMPTSFTLVIDGKRILNTIQGSRAMFPRMMAGNIEIEFMYNQPIRFTEVGVGSNLEEVSNVRFIYQPKGKYSIYLDSPLGREYIPSPAVNLFKDSNVTELSVLEINKNTQYKERDTDTDGIPDSSDNCPSQINSDQKDGNNNGTGDVCDDYDYDGVPTYVDNCPQMENPDQKDTDKDGVGDVCDTEESRVTEKYKWIPWVVFIGVFMAIGGMGYQVIKMKNKEA